MDAVDFLKAKDEMCTNHDNCRICPMGILNNRRNETCEAFMSLHPDEAVKIVEDWAENHPDVDKIFYICDGLGCETARLIGECPDPLLCKYTTNITHAKNFEQKDYGEYWEVNK